MILKIKKIAIIEQGSPDVKVELTAVNEGVDGSAVFGFTNEHNTIIIEGGQSFSDYANANLDIRVLSPSDSDATQLQTWADNNTDLYIVALCIDGVIAFGNKETQLGLAKISLNKSLSNNNVFAFKITKKSIYGYDSNAVYQSGLYMGNNLLANTDFLDTNGSGGAQEWSSGGFISRSFSNGQQTLEFSTVLKTFSKEVYFPFDNETVTFSLLVNQAATTPAVERIRITFLDSNGSTISSISNTSLTDSSVNSISGNTPTGTFALNLQYSAQTSSGNDTVILSQPKLSVGTDTTYTKF